jgi:hypothetical protein
VKRDQHVPGRKLPTRSRACFVNVAIMRRISMASARRPCRPFSVLYRQEKTIRSSNPME